MEKVLPEEIMKVLKEHGTEVSVEDAKRILEFMYMIAEMALDVYVNSLYSKKLVNQDSSSENSLFI